MVSSTHAGRIGPICIFVSPNDNKLQRIETAFCSIQLNTNVTGKSFNPISNNSVSAVNISAPTIDSAVIDSEDNSKVVITIKAASGLTLGVNQLI